MKRNSFEIDFSACLDYVFSRKVLKLQFLLSIFYIDRKFLQEANIGMRFITLKWKLKYVSWYANRRS